LQICPKEDEWRRKLQSPIFVYGEGYISVFSSREKAEAYLEAVDVAKGIYKAYDSQGYLLQISVRGEDEVCINQPSDLVKMDLVLHDLLQDFFRQANRILVSEDWLAGASLSDLVAKSLEYKTW
jgi:hypothetical protein